MEDEAKKRLVFEQHKKINAGYFSDHTLVPLKFGNIVDNEEEVRRFLTGATIQLKSLIEKVSAKSEIIIQVSFDIPKAIEEIAKDVDMSNKEAVGKAFFELSQKHKTALGQAMRSGLSDYVTDYVERTDLAETVILQNSYLVENSREELFGNALNEIAEECEDYLAFNYVGPLPAYSFVSTEFNKGQFDLINEARLVLGLDKQCSLDEIKSAYKKTALKAHPDKNDGEDTKMKELNEAYRVVNIYCNSVNNDKCSLSKDAIERSFAAY